MPSMNRVFLAGNLTRDPELRKTTAGQSVSDLGLAVNERYRNPDGEEVERTCFIEVVVWDKPAEACQQYLTKGSPVLVEGKLQQNRWETDDGQKHSKIRIQATRVQFLNRSNGNGNGETPAEAAPAEGAPAESEENMPF